MLHPKLVLALAAIFILPPAAQAGEPHDRHGTCAHGDCDGRCEEYASCRVDVSREKVKKHCWEVKCEQICIPPIQFPWQKCHQCGSKSCNCEQPTGCGRVITVRRLVRREFECNECKYDWKLESPCGGDCAAGKNSDAGQVESGKPLLPAPPVPQASHAEQPWSLEANRWSRPPLQPQR